MDFFHILNAAIRQAEETYPNGNGEVKRQMVIELAIALLPAPRWMPNFIKRWALGLLIDFAIWLLNNRFTKEWLKTEKETNDVRPYENSEVNTLA